jgi:hypothetical protein
MTWNALTAQTLRCRCEHRARIIFSKTQKRTKSTQKHLGVNIAEVHQFNLPKQLVRQSAA